MSGQDAHNEYMQAASKIARIRTLLAELPPKLEEAQNELEAAVEALGADPLGLLGRVPVGRKIRPKGEAERLFLSGLPGTVSQIAVKSGLDPSHVSTIGRKMMRMGRATRTGEPGAGGSGGYVYHRADAAQDQAA